jgi:hypothetical protein
VAIDEKSYYSAHDSASVTLFLHLLQDILVGLFFKAILTAICDLLTTRIDFVPVPPCGHDNQTHHLEYVPWNRYYLADFLFSSSC